jgi:serine/threonine-protein kinase
VTEIPSQLAAALAPRSELRGAISKGGMATVYLARDARHHREVAIKVLRPDLAASIRLAALARELVPKRALLPAGDKKFLK